MSRLVITPWNGRNSELLDRCIESVKCSGIEHRVVKCGPEWETTMYSMRNDADAVAWVDADDIVYPGALLESFNAIENNNVGLVYTNECRIDINDKVLCTSTSGKKTLWDIASHPSCVHHLSVTKRHTESPRVLEIYRKTHIPLDWALRVDLAARYGMMHVDTMGYGWRLHKGQITSGRTLNERMSVSLQTVRNEFREWVTKVRQV